MACRQLGLGYANHGLQVSGKERGSYDVASKAWDGAEDYGNESHDPEGWMEGPHRNAYICPQETWYWDSGNVTEVVMSGVRCTGTELSLDQCAHHSTHIACKRTGTHFTAGVICSESK